MKRLTCTTLALALVLGGCGDDDAVSTTESTPATTTTAPATTVAAPTTASPTTTNPPATTGTPPATAPVACSASDMTMPVFTDDLPAPVTATANAIAAAAIACDYESLAALGNPPLLLFTIDPRVEVDDPAAYWAEMEAFGATPMASLIGHLYLIPALNAATDDLWEDGTVYVWPAVAAYGSGSTAPDWAWTNLESYYGTEDMEAFMADVYQGTRVGITTDGDWVWFFDLVAGG